MADTATETGVDLTKYMEERDAGIVSIVKNDTNSGNYIFARTPYIIQLVNGVPTAVPGTSTVLNINLGSVNTIREKVLADKAKLENILTQLAAIEADMLAL